MSKRKKKKKHNRKYRGQDSFDAQKKHNYFDILFICLIFLLVFLTNLVMVNMEGIQPDSSIYLDMGRNVYSGTFTHLFF